MNMEMEMAVHSSILAWSLVGFSPWDGGPDSGDAVDHLVDVGDGVGGFPGGVCIVVAVVCHS